MATLPTTLQHKTTQTPTRRDYSVDDFIQFVKSILDKKYDQNISTTDIYRKFGIKLSGDSINLISKLNDSLLKLVKKSQDNGYNPFNSTDGITESKILTAIGLDTSDTMQTTEWVKWLNANYELIIGKIKSIIDDVTANITDATIALVKNAKTSLENLVNSYGLDLDKLPSNNPIKLIWVDLQKSLVSDFHEYVGDSFDPHTPEFYDKSRFDSQKYIDDLVNDTSWKVMISKSVEEAIKEESKVLAASTSATIRDFLKAEYNKNVNSADISLVEFDSIFIPGIKAIIEKYIQGKKISYNGVIFNNFLESGSEYSVTASLQITIDGIPKVVEFPLTLQKVVFHIEELEKIVTINTFGYDAVFDIDVNWANGQTLTKSDLINAELPVDRRVPWTKLFQELDAYVATNPNVSYNIQFVNGEISFNFVDDNILPTDVEFGDKTPLITQEDLKYLFNRHNSVPKTEKPSDSPAKGFYPQLVFNKYIKPRFISRLDQLINELKIATDINGAHQVPLSLVYDKNTGTMKTVSPSDMERIFPSFKIMFLDKIPTGYTVQYVTTKPSQNIPGRTTLLATATSPSGQTKTYSFDIVTVDDTMLLSYVKEEIDKMENTWEDKTPSMPIFSYYAPMNPFAEGSIPSYDQLKDVFPNIESFKDLAKNLIKGKELLIMPGINKETQKSQDVDTKMMMVWMTLLAGDDPSRMDLVSSLVGSLLRDMNLKPYSNVSTYITTPVTISYGGSSVNAETKTIHFLSHQQRYAYSELMKKMLDKFTDGQLQDAEKLKEAILNRLKIILKPNDPNAKVPDWELLSIFKGISPKIIKIDANMLKPISKIFKYILTALGTLMGAASAIGVLIPIRTAWANRRYNKLHNLKKGSKRTSKKLIITSSLASLFAAGSSVGLMLYTLILQGGF